ncbi:MAG: hypothetical protein ACON39_03495 [Coraliomargaritaceae bacterium]
MTRRVSSFLWLFALTSLQAVPDSSVERPQSRMDPMAIQIEDTSCRVGLFAVKLSVGLLTQKENTLVGEYVIDVPLFQSKSDHGQVILPIDKPLESFGEKGGVLIGEGHSRKNPGEVHKIVCKILPIDNKRIELAITTSQRTVHFSSSYAVIEAGKDNLLMD